MPMCEFSLHEDFSCLGPDALPRTMEVEENTFYHHHCVRAENGIFYVSTAGNKYLLKTPDMADCAVCLSFSFHYAAGKTGSILYLRYDPLLRTGWRLALSMESACETVIALSRAEDETNILYTVSLPCVDPRQPGPFPWEIALNGDRLAGRFCGLPFSLTLPAGYEGERGRIGMAVIPSVGEMAVSRFSAESNECFETETVFENIRAEIPLRNGGNMPYTLTWSLYRIAGKPYLSFAFDGGAQYREQYPGYPRETGQYGVERDRITSPFLAVYGDALLPDARTELYNGKMTTVDPGLHWRSILGPYYGVVTLPITGFWPIWECANTDADKLCLSFGYARRETRGYVMQAENDVEFVFSMRDGTLLSSGRTSGMDGIFVSSPADKQAVAMIPDTLYAAEKVRQHLRDNHFFAEDEPIRFTVRVRRHAGFRFFSLAAALCDVWGDKLCSLDAVPIPADEGGDDIPDRTYRLAIAPLPVGVYRLSLTGSAGEDPVLTSDTVFEVFDRTGVRCAPLESGLPFLFSTPNEQRYLDRDAFDLWNPRPGCDMEHFFACTAFPGDIGAQKRVWEASRLFGRPWYVWLTDGRTMLPEEVEKYRETILKNADYVYLAAEEEFFSFRHDFFKSFIYRKNVLLRYLDEFRKQHPEYAFSFPRELTSLSTEQMDELLGTALADWVDFANDRLVESLRVANAEYAKINPAFKASCYGPCAIYVIPYATHNIIRYFGYKPDETLHEVVFTGFCQLEDYPVSCNYHTFRGAFFLMHTLLHCPGLVVYPEQYTSSAGGCIDGAVKNATPPLGKYTVPLWYGLTHACEYVYNTAYLTENGFAYWSSFGFMQRDFSYEPTDAFVRGWKHIREHLPAAHGRSMAFLSEIPHGDDRYERVKGLMNMFNISEVGFGYLNETARLSGVPGGFACDYRSLMRVDETVTDLLILPSMYEADSAVVEKVRSLYRKGVALFAVGDVSGLEDLFGVEKAPCRAEIVRMRTEDAEELIAPECASFLYRPTAEAEVLLTAFDRDGGEYPAVLRHGRTALINAPVTELGHAQYETENIYLPNISTTLRAVCSGLLRAFSSSGFVSDNCGITHFTDQNGEEMLLCIDYGETDHNMSQDITAPSEILVPAGVYAEVESVFGPAPAALREDGMLTGIRLHLHREETALLRLIPRCF